MSDEQLQRLESSVEVLGGRVEQVGQDLRNRIDEGQRQIHVLHEDLAGRIKALAPDYGPIRREFRREIGELRESIDRRLIPLQAPERMRRRPKR